MDEDIKSIYLNTNSINFAEACLPIIDLYKFCKKPIPRFIHVSGPKHLKSLLKNNKEKPFNTKVFNDIAHFTSRYRSSAKHRIEAVIKQVFYTKDNNIVFPANYPEIPNEKFTYENITYKICQQCYLCITCENTCYIMDRPLKVCTNDQGFHNPKGPSVLFRDGTKIYCYEGQQVKKEWIKDPTSISLEDINNRKCRYKLIKLAGIERYLELINNYQIDTKNKLSGFLSLSKLSEYKTLYKNEQDAYQVTIRIGNINGEHGIIAEEKDGYNVFFVPSYNDSKITSIFNEEDTKFWNLLNLREAFYRSPGLIIKIIYYNNKYKVFSENKYSSNPPCSHSVIPSWFQAKMMETQQDIEYHNDLIDAYYKINPDTNERELEVTSTKYDIKPSVFYEVPPHYKFNFSFESDTWEGLLKQWAEFSFKWLSMHENPMCLSDC